MFGADRTPYFRIGLLGQVFKWRGRLDRGYGPRRQLLSIPVDAGELPGMLAERRPQDDTVAYICEGLSCRAPVTDEAEFNNLAKTTP